MKFNFIEKKLQIDPEIKSYAEKKVGKLDKFFKQDSEATIAFSTERGRCRVEVTLNNNGMFYRASELTNDMYASLDSACALIVRQIRKNKTRLEKKLREGVVDHEFEVEYAPVEKEEENETFEIIRTKRFSLKPMTAEEAILQMNLLEHEFFAFLNMDDNDSFSVVYKRKNGGYGLISAADV
ncbi:MAG: ribosome-associated translation inhibitor RaiA [Ruminococcaceae bacterium]|nr:ribosome-associated translation inhibitor RaiA [Oscillospiraceae bacterium]